MTNEILSILIEVFGTIVTVISILLAVKELKTERNRNISDTFLKELISNLCEASKATYSFLKLSKETSEDDEKEMDANLSSFVKGQKDVYNSILVHGDKRTIVLFNQIYQDLKRDNSSTLGYFRSCSMVLPLIVSNVKYYATGEKINPSTVFSYCMTEIEKHLDDYIVSRYYKDMVELNNELVKRYRLKKFLIWNYEYSVEENQIWNVKEEIDIDDKRKLFTKVPNLTAVILGESKKEPGIFVVMGLLDEIDSNQKLWKCLNIDNVTKYVTSDCIYKVSYKQLIGVCPISTITDRETIDTIKEFKRDLSIWD